MAAYDSSSIKSANTLNLDDLITKLNNLAMKWDTTTFSDTTVSSTSYTAPGTHTVTSIEADEICIFIAKCTLSASVRGDIGVADLFINSVGQARYGYYREPDITGITVSGTTGKAATCTLIGFAQNLSGSNTFELQVKRESGSGSIGVANITSDVLRIKRR